jgi:hypothetical protein
VVTETTASFIDQARVGCGGRGGFGDRRRIAETLADVIESALDGGASITSTTGFLRRAVCDAQPSAATRSAEVFSERIVDFIDECRLRGSSGPGECDDNWENVYGFLERLSAPPGKPRDDGGGQEPQDDGGSDGAGSHGEDDVRADDDVDAPLQPSWAHDDGGTEQGGRGVLGDAGGGGASE